MNIKYKQQKGFSIFAVILVIVAVIVAIGIWALSGQSNAQNNSDSTNDIMMSEIINGSSSIKLAYDKLVINGANPLEVNYSRSDEPDALNILDPLTGIEEPNVNLKAFIPGIIHFPGDNNEEVDRITIPWALIPFFQSNLYSGKKPIIMLIGITDALCKKINTVYNGVNFDITMSPDNGGISNLIFPNEMQGAKLGCFKIGYPQEIDNEVGGFDSLNYFFRIL